MEYKTTFANHIDNSITLTSVERTRSSTWTYLSANSGGDASGNTIPVTPAPVPPTPPVTPEQPSVKPVEPTKPDTPETPTKPSEKHTQQKTTPKTQTKKSRRIRKHVLPNTGDNAASIAMLGGMVLFTLTAIATARKMKR